MNKGNSDGTFIFGKERKFYLWIDKETVPDDKETVKITIKQAKYTEFKEGVSVACDNNGYQTTVWYSHKNTTIDCVKAGRKSNFYNTCYKQNSTFNSIQKRCI